MVFSSMSCTHSQSKYTIWTSLCLIFLFTFMQAFGMYSEDNNEILAYDGLINHSIYGITSFRIKPVSCQLEFLEQHCMLTHL